MMNTNATDKLNSTAPPAQVETSLASLLSKGQSAQYQSCDDFDWSLRATLPLWLPKSMAASAISQFYFGEITTSRMCRQILNSVDGATARDFLEIQALDEDRHSEIYLKYLNKIGGLAKINPAVDNSYRQALSWTGAPEAIILAFHVILEGESLRLQHDVDDWMPCPLFKEIAARIARDEARHVAFGKIYLKQSLPHLLQAQRLEIYVWVRDLWLDAIKSLTKGLIFPTIFFSSRRNSWIQQKWRERLPDLMAAGLFDQEEQIIFEQA